MMTRTTPSTRPSRQTPSRTLGYVALALAVLVSAVPTASAWEAVTRYRGSGTSPDSQGIKAITPLSIVQHSYNVGSPSWEYFTLYVSSTGERHTVIFYDLANPAIAAVVQQFRDAYNYNKKVKWVRGVGRVTVPASGTTLWQGYNTVQYPVYAGDLLEVIFA